MRNQTAQQVEQGSTLTFGNVLRMKREESGYSIEELAALAGITGVQLRKLENVTSEPTARTLVKLAIALNISVDELSAPFREAERAKLQAQLDEFKAANPDLGRVIGTLESELNGSASMRQMLALLKTLNSERRREGD